jgi:hypothetical protein
MGTWGEGIYDDDEACDVRDTISLLSQMPVTGERMLEILLTEYERNEDLTQDGCPTFWITVADQFEKKGIECERVYNLAQKAIMSGADIDDLKNREMEVQGLRKRAQLTEKILPRFINPKLSERKRVAENRPKCCVNEGQIYTYPTMNGAGFNAWASNWEDISFKPNGWGCLLIVEVGRVFDWFPYCAYTPLITNPGNKATFAEAISSRTLFSTGVCYCHPRSLHFKRMNMELVGTCELNNNKKKLIDMSDSSPKDAIVCDWSICSGAFSVTEVNKGYFDVSDIIAQKC